MKTSEIEERILRSLRRVTRAIDLHSRKLAGSYGLTAPQLVCLRMIATEKEATPTVLAKDVSLSLATVTGIVDRLSARQLVTRERSEEDRRLVHIRATEAGLALIEAAPSPLQENFVGRLRQLGVPEQDQIAQTLDRIVEMMDGEGIDAAPVLTNAADIQPDQAPEV